MLICYWEPPALSRRAGYPIADIFLRIINFLMFENDGTPKKSIKKKETAQLIPEDFGEITVFAKLPNFKIPTPLGDYFPDFAYVIKKNSGEQIFFVCETKGYENEISFDENARYIEKNKIKCAERFFEALSKIIRKYKYKSNLRKKIK